MADEHSSDPAPDRVPDYGLSLGAHEALSLLSGTSLGYFFEWLPATVWMTDPKLTLTFVHGSMLRTWQIGPEKLIGRTLPDLVLDGREDHPLIQGHHTALSGHEASVRIEWGGNLYNARIAPLRDSTGAIIGCVGSHQQIGWLPDDDGLLRESDMRLRRIIDSNMIGIAFGNDEGQITEANEAFLHLAGYTREDLVADGISWPALTPIDCHPRQLAAIEEVRQTGRCTPFEVDLIRKDGTHVPVLVGGARLSARRREGVAFVLDISERRNLRRRLAAELACADALLDANSAEAALTGALEALCTTLDWQVAQFWRCGTADAIERIAGVGTMTLDAGVFQRMAVEARDKRQPQWSDANHGLAVPTLVNDRCASVLIVARTTDAPLDAQIVDAVQAIGDRLQKFVNK